MASFSASPWQPRQTALGAALPGGLSLWQPWQFSPFAPWRSARKGFACAQTIPERLAATIAEASRTINGIRIRSGKRRQCILSTFHSCRSKEGADFFKAPFPRTVIYLPVYPAVPFISRVSAPRRSCRRCDRKRCTPSDFRRPGRRISALKRSRPP